MAVTCTWSLSNGKSYVQTSTYQSGSTTSAARFTINSITYDSGNITISGGLANVKPGSGSRWMHSGYAWYLDGTELNFCHGGSSGSYNSSYWRNANNNNWGDAVSCSKTVAYKSTYTIKVKSMYNGGYSAARWKSSSYLVTSDDVTLTVTVPSYSLDLNGWLDGASSGGLGDYGRADVYINGSLASSQVSDYYASHPYGTTYEFKNINATAGHTYNGVYSGSLSGTLTANASTYLNFTTNNYNMVYYPYGGTYNGTTANSTFTQAYGSTLAVGFPTPPTGHVFASYHTNGSLTGISSSDSVFESGYGGIGVYNNSGNGTVTHNRVQDNTVPSKSYGDSNNGYKVVISKVAGTASPGCGGFYLGTNSTAGHTYRCFIWAKIPTTHYIQDYRNAIGDGGYSVWLTEQRGTGNWYKYVYEVHAGSSGSFSNFGHVALQAYNGDNNAAVTWEVCATQITDITNNLTYTYPAGDRYIECYQAPLKYTITYNANSGSGAPENTVYTYASSGSTNLSSTIPTRDGYNFLGWSQSSTATSASYSAGQAWSLSNNSNYTLYAVWKLKTYTISYAANGGSSTPNSQTKTHGVNLTIASAISRANSTANGYTVTFNANGGSVSPTTKTATDTTTYSFTGWKSSATGTTWSGGATNFSENNATTLTAQWSSSTTKGSVATSSATRSNGTATRTVTFDATTNGGTCSTSSLNSTATITYTGNGWYTDASGGTKRCDNGGTYTPSASETVYQQWSSSTGSYSAITLPAATKANGSANRTVTINANGGTSTVPSRTSTATITYTQTGWWTASSGGTNRGNSGATYTPSAAEKIYAQFSSSTGNYSAVTLPTTTECTRPEYILLGFSTSDTAATATYAPGASYTPSANIILYAVWELDQATVWYKNSSGTWVKGKVWYKDSTGTWVKAKKFYTKTSNGWIENKTTS